MNDTTHALRPTGKQLKMITALLWQLRPYYLFPLWREITEQLDRVLRNATRMIASRVIQRMLAAMKEKRNSPKVWIPMDYRLDNSIWQKNLAKAAAFLFGEDAADFDNLDARDTQSWRKLKNRIEREELKRAIEKVPDEFESDTRLAEEEEERWKRDKPPYAQTIAGIDYLEPTPGIDF